MLPGDRGACEAPPVLDRARCEPWASAEPEGVVMLLWAESRTDEA